MNIEIKKTAEEFVINERFPIGEWVQVTHVEGQIDTWFDNVQIIKTELTKLESDSAFVQIDYTIDITEDEEKRTEERTIEVYLEVNDGQWFVDNWNE